MSASLADDSLIETCGVDGQSHLFHSDIVKSKIDIYYIDDRQFEYHQFIAAKDLKV